MPDAISWREKAAELRAAAERTADLVTQQSLLVLAEDCDAFAKEDAPARPGALASTAPRDR
jgi:hypothetical protein